LQQPRAEQLAGFVLRLGRGGGRGGRLGAQLPPQRAPRAARRQLQRRRPGDCFCRGCEDQPVDSPRATQCGEEASAAGRARAARTQADRARVSVIGRHTVWWWRGRGQRRWIEGEGGGEGDGWRRRRPGRGWRRRRARWGRRARRVWCWWPGGRAARWARRGRCGREAARAAATSHGRTH